MTSKRNNNILIRLKIICVIKKRALIFWYYKTTILKKKKKVSQKFLSRQKPISVGSKRISRNSDKFLETPYRSFLEIYRSFSKSFWTHGNRYFFWIPPSQCHQTIMMTWIDTHISVTPILALPPKLLFFGYPHHGATKH